MRSPEHEFLSEEGSKFFTFRVEPFSEAKTNFTTVSSESVSVPLTLKFEYSKYTKISYTKVFDKMACANSVDPDQTAPEGAV